MSIQKFIIAGFGGQGVMSLGQMLIYAGMLEGKEVTWLPSYGPEMRGGTANCNVVVSSEPISSPVVTKATSLIAMNLPSLTKFEGNLIEGGSLFINSSLIDVKTSRNDIDAYYIDANNIATELGNDQIANMIMLGAIIEKTKVVSFDSLQKVLEKMFAKKPGVIPINMNALKKGASLVK